MRESFISQHWSPYPPMPQIDGMAGRIIEINNDRFTLDSPQGLQSIEWMVHWLHWKSILISGDIIFVPQNAEKDLTLLAPKNREFFQYQKQKEILKKWQEFKDKIHHFFYQRGFIHIDTPSLVDCPGTEPYLDPFFIEGKGKYLPTSPELSLKKALAGGLCQVYEMRSCFRDHEQGPHHLKEFTLLEWYRAYSDLMSIAQDLLQLLEHLLGQKIQLQEITVAQLFMKYLDFELTPNTTEGELKKLIPMTASNWSWDEMFHWIWLEKIESQWDPEVIRLVTKYPPGLAAYSRIVDGWADRFELYWRGFEIANAFHEVNDPEVQRVRMQNDNQKKLRLGKTTVNLDHHFFSALESAMPPSGGIALGVERLFMAIHGITEIRELKLFSD